jgi:hypothetical protein
MKHAKFAVAIALTVALASCARQPATLALLDGPGFFMGIVHGLIAPIALVGGIFTDVRTYAFPNGGWWYDFGFILGIGAWGGGGAAARRKRRV